MDRAQAIRTQVIGFLTPIFVDRNLRTGETVMNGLDEEGFAKVMAGYACANCLAEFASFTVTCPVCGETRDLTDDVPETPELWLAAMRDRETPPPVTRPSSDVASLVYRQAEDAEDLTRMIPKRQRSARKN